MKIKAILLSLLLLPNFIQAQDADIEWEEEETDAQPQSEYVEVQTRRPRCITYFTYPSHWYRCHYYYYNRDQNATWPTRIESTFYDDLTR